MTFNTDSFHLHQRNMSFLCEDELLCIPSFSRDYVHVKMKIELIVIPHKHGYELTFMYTKPDQIKVTQEQNLHYPF